MARAVSVLALILALAWPAPSRAHPHVFIDAGFDLLFDEAGELAGIRVFWAYDEFYSMLLIEDRGFDPDGDGALTDAELAEIAGTDVDWDAGFPGDLYVAAGDTPVSLERPVEHGARYQDGRIVTFHTRPLTERIDPETAPLSIKIYDVTFFVAYDVTLPTTVENRDDCRVARETADIDAANERFEDLLSLLPEDDGELVEMNFPAVGAYYADTFRLTCSGSS